MSNAQNQFLQGFTNEQFLALWGDFLQGKVDKVGGTVDGPASNTRLASTWMNLADDLILATAQQGPMGGVIVENRDAPHIVPSLTAGSFSLVQISVTTPHNVLEFLWWSMIRNATGIGSNKLLVELYSDADAMNLVMRRQLSQDHTIPSLANDLMLDESDWSAGFITLGALGLLLPTTDGGVTHRFTLKVTNLNAVNDTPEYKFAFVARAFTLPDVTITIHPPP